MGALERGVYCLGVATNASAANAAEVQRQKALDRLETHKQRKYEAKMAIEFARQKREQEEAVRREEERWYRIQMDAIRAEEANQRANAKMQARTERVHPGQERILTSEMATMHLTTLRDAPEDELSIKRVTRPSPWIRDFDIGCSGVLAGKCDEHD